MRIETSMATAWVLASRRWPRGDDEILALQVRNRVYHAVVEQPGVHVSEVARLVGISPNHARYHLDTLARAGMVSGQSDGGFVRYYVRAHDRGLSRDALAARDKEIMGALRRERPLHVALVLLADGALALKDVAARVGRTPATVHFHLGGLVKRGLVRAEGEGNQRRYAVADAAELTAFLVRYPPQPDLVGSFVDLWNGLALPKSGPAPAAAAGGGAMGASATPPLAAEPEGPDVWRPRNKAAWFSLGRMVGEGLLSA